MLHRLSCRRGATAARYVTLFVILSSSSRLISADARWRYAARYAIMLLLDVAIIILMMLAAMPFHAADVAMMMIAAFRRCCRLRFRHAAS